MFLWFAGVGFVGVWSVFRSPSIDYRLVMLGSVAPVGEVLVGGPRLLHALVFSVAAMAVVMLATGGRRLVQRRWMSLAIGLMMHLVLDGVWTRSQVFLWPFFGTDFGEGGLPELTHPIAVTLLLEAVGAAALVWVWVTFDFGDPRARDEFMRTGHLPRTMS